MRKVFKYAIPTHDTFTLTLPRGAQVLTFADQDRQIGQVNLVLWALVEPDAPSETRAFRLAGTGHPIEGDAPLRYVATALLMNGAFVLHLFEVLAGEETRS